MGSNIDPEDNLRAAAAYLRTTFPGARFSHVYESAPLLFITQPPFLNAVMVADTDLSPMQVYDVLKEIEQELKKDPPVRHGPRTIDLDLLLYDSVILPDRTTWEELQVAGYKNAQGQPATFNMQLIVPHPRMHERRFVLKPLSEVVDPQERHPIIDRTWRLLLSSVNDQEVAATNLVL